MILGPPFGLAAPRLAVPPQEPDLLREDTDKDLNAGAFSELLEELERQAPPIAEKDFASSDSYHDPHTQDVMVAPIRSSTGRTSASADHFSSEVTIGESAVPFAARPIVAPGESETGGALTRPPASFPTESRPFTFDAHHGLRGVPLDTDAFGDTGTAVFDRASIVPDPALILGQRNANGSLTALPIQVGAVSGSRPTVSHTSLSPSAFHGSRSLTLYQRDGAAPASVPRIMAQTSAASSTFAQLVAGQSEYRLIIRGQRLNAGEKEQLIQDLNLTLSELGLPLQPVRLLVTEGGL